MTACVVMPYLAVHIWHGVTLPQYLDKCAGNVKKNNLQCRLGLSCYHSIKYKFSCSLVVIDQTWQIDNFSSLTTLVCRQIISSILKITPADWTANRPIVEACNLTA